MCIILVVIVQKLHLKESWLGTREVAAGCVLVNNASRHPVYWDSTFSDPGGGGKVGGGGDEGDEGEHVVQKQSCDKMRKKEEGW